MLFASVIASGESSVSVSGRASVEWRAGVSVRAGVEAREGVRVRAGIEAREGVRSRSHSHSDFVPYGLDLSNFFG